MTKLVLSLTLLLVVASTALTFQASPVPSYGPYDLIPCDGPSPQQPCTSYSVAYPPPADAQFAAFFTKFFPRLGYVTGHYSVSVTKVNGFGVMIGLKSIATSFVYANGQVLCCTHGSPLLLLEDFSDVGLVAGSVGPSILSSCKSELTLIQI